MKSLIIIYLILVFFLCGCSSIFDKFGLGVLYPSSQVNKSHPPVDAIDGVTESVMSDGTVVWVQNGEAPLAIYLHGNGMSLSAIAKANLFKYFSDIGIRVVTYDFPSYGKVPGEPSEATMTRQAQMVFDAHKPTIIFGRSLGSAVAFQLAKQNEVEKFVILSPWSSFQELGAEKSWMFKFLSDEFLEAHKWDSKSVAASIKARSFLGHGNKDTLIPIHHGKSLADVMPGIQFLELETGHNDIFQSKELKSALEEFFK